MIVLIERGTMTIEDYTSRSEMETNNKKTYNSIVSIWNLVNNKNQKIVNKNTENAMDTHYGKPNNQNKTNQKRR